MKRLALLGLILGEMSFAYIGKIKLEIRGELKVTQGNFRNEAGFLNDLGCQLCFEYSADDTGKHFENSRLVLCGKPSYHHERGIEGERAWNHLKFKRYGNRVLIESIRFDKEFFDMIFQRGHLRDCEYDSHVHFDFDPTFTPAEQEVRFFNKHFGNALENSWSNELTLDATYPGFGQVFFRDGRSTNLGKFAATLRFRQFEKESK